jgi:antitoxin (DNA-binding transcriptional repressor) of toxin-antitoxin stability system
MPTKSVDVRDLPGRLMELLASGADEEIIITDGQVPRARLIPLAHNSQARIPGLHPGAIQTADDFDEPLPDQFWTGSE